MRLTIACPDAGLSPRVRGSLDQRETGQAVAGSIPAGAGEPISSRLVIVILRVYPRGCGGAGQRLASRVLIMGLSPRVRGSRHRL